MKRWLRAGVVTTALLWLPSLAFACPVCFSQANPHILRTYYFTTVLLTLLPLALVGILGGWLYKRSAELARCEAEATETAPTLAANATQT